jgi:hypothetical protein
MAELPTTPPQSQLHATTEGVPALQPQELFGLDDVVDSSSDNEPQLQQEAGIAGHGDAPAQQNEDLDDDLESLFGEPFEPLFDEPPQQQHGVGLAGLALPPRPQQDGYIAGLLARFEQDVGLAGPAQQPAATAPETTTVAVAQAHPDEYPCVECPEHFETVDGRAAHMRPAHSNEDGFLCHECPFSCSDGRQYVRHANDHSDSRPRSYHAPCFSMKCDDRSFSADVLDRHRREDHHASNDSHQAQCPRPECAYLNDSIVGVWVHILHVHSEAAVPYRKQAAERKREAEALAARLASQAALRETAARAAASDASSDTVPSSPIETIEGTGDNSSPATAEPATRKRKLSPEEEEELAEKTATAADTLLAAQLTAHKSQTPEEAEQFGLNTKERKKFKVRAKKAAAKAAAAARAAEGKK